MNTMTTKSKTCAICSTDCSNTPRYKDEAGHYFHKACYDEKRLTDLYIAASSSMASSSHHVASILSESKSDENRFSKSRTHPVHSDRTSLHSKKERVTSGIDFTSDSVFLIGLLLSIPLLTMFHFVSFLLALGVYLLGMIHLVVAGFRISPVWGILNIVGFFVPIIWLAFVVIHWEYSKRTFYLMCVSGVSLTYLLYTH